MKVFLIVLAVLVLLFAMLLSLSVHATVIYDNGWHTFVQILFFEKEVELSKILNFVLFPEKAGKEKAEELKKEKQEDVIKEEQTKKVEKETPKPTPASDASKKGDEPVNEQNSKPAKEKKGNFITKIIDEDGIVGILLLASNLVETLNSAIITLFKGLHIYSLYVKMIIGGGDAADIGEKYGKICGIYYPIKGVILNGMKVDQYDDYVQADFIAPKSEYEFQLIASMNVALVLKIALKAGKVFLVNLIKNK
ncbi:MAG: hypothetical protein ACI4IL_09065 [Eubacterium sp.]